MKFNDLCIYFEKIESTSSRLTMTELLADLFKRLTPEETEKTMYLLQGRVVPLFEKVEFGMAEKTVIKSIVRALHIDKKVFETHFRKTGDVGLTVEHLKRENASLLERNLSIVEVYDLLLRMAKTGGEGSLELKINILSDLIQSVEPLAARYIVRIPMAIMRLGFSDMTILDAFSWMLAKDKSLRPQIESAYHVRPDLGYLGKMLKIKGIDGIRNPNPKLFTPIIMMRAERLSSAEEIIEKIGACAIEPKYDGFRLQIHYHRAKNDVRLYSRNLEEVSFMYPDIIEGVKKEIHASDVVFEGEAVGFDLRTGNFLPFQETVQRKRKYNIEEKVKEIPLKLFAFELLSIDGENLLRTPYLERNKKLRKIVDVTGDIHKDTILMSPETIIKEGKLIELFFDDAISKGLEGIMAKKLDGIYQPGARGWNWIKYKRSYSSKIDDTIDCLVLGYDRGRGKRADFGIGAFLAAVYDAKKDKFVTVAKIGTGLSDIEWRELKKRADVLKTQTVSPLYEVDKLMSTDVWIKPGIIVEIKADEITRSPVHTAGRTLKESKSGSSFIVDVPGYALRFPRLERFRDDKRPEDATTLQELEEMSSQAVKNR